MNIHKNARLTFARRLEMIQDVLERKLSRAAAAAKHHVSEPTVRKWVGRYLAQGEPGLRDASSRPAVSPRAIAPQTALAIVELRRRFLTHARIAQSLGVSGSTVWLLTALLEDYFLMRGMWYQGPKKSFQWLRTSDPVTYGAFEEALKSGASFRAIDHVVALAIDTSQALDGESSAA